MTHTLEKALPCLGGCPEASEKLGIEESCCRSCHDEFDIELSRESEIYTKEGYFLVCCSVRMAFDEKEKK